MVIKMKFKDMPNERVDLVKMGEEFDKLTEKVRNAKDGETVVEAFREQDKLSTHIQTMSSIA